MAICGGLVRPKNENVKKPLVLLLFFEGPKRLRERVAPPNQWFWSHFGDGDFALYTMLAKIGFRKCASCLGGEHIFIKIMKKLYPNIKNAIKIMSDTSKCHQHNVAYMKMSSKWCRIHGSSRPRKPPVAIIHVFARIFDFHLGGQGGDKRGKGRTTERQDWK